MLRWFLSEPAEQSANGGHCGGGVLASLFAIAELNNASNVCFAPESRHSAIQSGADIRTKQTSFVGAAHSDFS